MRILFLSMLTSSILADETYNSVETALEYVFTARENCEWGTLKPLPLLFDTSAWSQLTDPAIRNTIRESYSLDPDMGPNCLQKLQADGTSRTANLLTKLLVLNDGTLDSVDDKLIFLMVRNNVHGDSLIFGSAVGFEKFVFSYSDNPGSEAMIIKSNEHLILLINVLIYNRYNVFCPYAYKENGTVRSHDLASNYNCHDPRAEWYYTLKIRDYSNLTVVTDKTSYRENDSYHPEVEEVYPVAQLTDGYWTKPYYDCGGGEIWMVTYSCPFFKLVEAHPVFQGVVTIDIELNKIDINQCDSTDEKSTSGLDVFMGSHRCQPTTKCVPVRGLGFVTGAYSCKCKDGFYYPFTVSDAFPGVEIEQFYRDGREMTPDMFRCFACAAGCETCVDSSPCLYERSEVVLICLTFLMVVTILGVTTVAAFTYIYRDEMAIKTASPIFLQLMCLGGAIMCCQFFLFYPEASLIVCYIRIWPRHVGFVIMYGSLILKTWRISVIFTVGAQKRVRLPNQVLLQRFALIIIIWLVMLTAWTTSQPPNVYAIKSEDGLKFYDCDFGPWGYAALGVEIIFLLYGVYLCYTVRKVPANFNESKHITWAVYNAIILGTFMAFMSNLVETVIGPDVSLLLEFIQIQVYVTVTFTLIFAPKFIALYRKTADVHPNAAATLASVNTIQTITGRVKKTQVAPIPAEQ